MRITDASVTGRTSGICRLVRSHSLALAASGTDPFAHAKSGGRGAVSYLMATVGQDTDPGAIERTIIAISMVRQRFPLGPSAAGTAVRFEPGQTRDVSLVALAGKRTVYGFRGDVMGKL